MQIYVDLRCLQDPRYAPRGIGQHALGVLRQARRCLAGSLELVGLVDGELPPLAEAHRALVDGVRQSLLPRDRRLKVFLQPSPMTHEPARLGGLVGAPGVLSCALVYDFIPLEDPRYLPTPRDFRAYLASLGWLKLHDLFCPISAHTSRRLTEVLGVDESRQVVTGAVVRPAFTGFDPAHAPATPACSFAPQRYTVLVGGHCLRKNTECAVTAHAELTRTVEGAGLVVVGNYGDDYRAHLTALYEQHGGRPGGLEFLRDVRDEDLAVLYHHALACLCPSLREGFSLPVAEALACRCPVLASDIPVHRELLGSQGLFDPGRSAELAGLLLELFRRPGRRGDLLAEQVRESGGAQGFREEDVAERVWGLVERHLRSRRVPAALSAGALRPRVAVLSPYPPERSGVADYTSWTLRGLARLASVDVYTDAPSPRPDPWVRRMGPLGDHPYVSGEYDRVLSVVGNSYFHARIIDLHRRYGGPCLAHDNRLLELYWWWRGPDGAARLAGKALGRTVSVQEVSSWMARPDTVPTLFLDEIVHRADPFLVHSRVAGGLIRAQYGVEPVVLPFCPYRSFREGELTPAARAQARRRLGMPEGQEAVVSFGMVGPTKAPQECVLALGHLRKVRQGAQTVLYFVGPSGGYRAALAPLIAELGLKEAVFFADEWISEETYRDYLLGADVGLQLRTYGSGQVSGALSDCVSAGLPVVASADLAESIDAPEYVLRVADHRDAAGVAGRLREALEGSWRWERRTEARAAYLAEHNERRYGARLLEALGVR